MYRASFIILYYDQLFCMIICEIIVHLLFTVQNNGRSTTLCEIIVYLLGIVQNNGRSIICEIIVHLLLTVHNNRRSTTVCEIIVNLLGIVQNNGRSTIICEIIVHLLVTVQNNAVLTVNTILIFKVSTKTRGARHRLEMSVVFAKRQAAHMNQIFLLCLVQNWVHAYG